jgi:ADP-heptose:LPS heptosyltransferase
MLLKILEAALPNRRYGPEDLDLESLTGVLVIRQHDQLGDLLLSTPAFRALRQALPGARITVVAREYTYRVLENNPDIDQILVFPEKLRLASPLRLWRLWQGLRQGHQLAVVLNTVSHSLSSDLLALFSRARYVLGSAENPFPVGRDNIFYNLLAPAPETRLHETIRNLKILEYVGIPPAGLGERLELNDSEMSEGKEFLYRQHLNPERTVGIHLGASNLCNRWPCQQYAKLSDWLISEYGYQVAVFWGPGEQELGERFLGLAQNKAAIISGLDLRRLAAVIKPLKLMVCNDTGVMHLSAAVGTPTFAIFGRSRPDHWRPLNPNFYGVQGRDKTRASAELAVVQSGVRRMLSR